MKRIGTVLLFTCAAGAASGEPVCIDEGYDALFGAYNTSPAPHAGVVLTVDPERPDPWLPRHAESPLLRHR